MIFLPVWLPRDKLLFTAFFYLPCLCTHFPDEPEILDAQGIYNNSSLGSQGTLPITVTVDALHGTIVVSSGERLLAGNPMQVPMTISRSEKGLDGKLNELWLIGSFMRGSLHMLKLEKERSGNWNLQVLDFASKESIETIYRSKIESP